MNQLKKVAYVIPVSAVLFFGACTANETQEEMLETALNGMCDKFQQCALESMEIEEGDESMPAAFMNMFLEQTKAQCATLMRREDIDPKDETMVEKSLACINDMSAASCESLMSGEEPESCKELETYQNQR